MLALCCVIRLTALENAAARANTTARITAPLISWPPSRALGLGYRLGWAMVSITVVAARIRMSFSPGATSTP